MGFGFSKFYTRQGDGIIEVTIRSKTVEGKTFANVRKNKGHS